MELDSITQLNTHKTPVLMVPGAFCSGKVWQNNFVPFFSEQGHDVHTLTFRGHGQPRLRKLKYGLSDYVDDLKHALDVIGQAPLIVAHSLGGLSSLKLMSEIDLPAAALISPVPLSGLRKVVGQTLTGDPLSALKWLGLVAEPKVRHLGAPPKGIYSDRVIPELASKITAQLDSESIRALIQTMKPQIIDTESINTPVKIIAATGDTITPVDLIKTTAEKLNAPLSIYEGMSHSVQAEPEWLEVANEIKDWFDQHETQIENVA